MNTVIISATVADQYGTLSINCDLSNSDLRSMGRRVSKRATLDGGVSFTDYGFSHGDRSFRVAAHLSKTSADVLEYIIQTFTSVLIATMEGVFLGAIEYAKVTSSQTIIDITIKEKLT